MVTITGKFSYVKTRSVPAQTKPYPRLVEVAKKQPTFEFRDVQGVLVGFRLPDYFEGINLTGYHLHFLTADRTGGGHLLGLTTKKIVVELDLTPEVRLSLPKTEAFAAASLGTDRTAEIHRVEKGK